MEYIKWTDSTQVTNLILDYDDPTALNSARRFYELAPNLSDPELAIMFKCSVYSVRRLREKSPEKPTWSKHKEKEQNEA